MELGYQSTECRGDDRARSRNTRRSAAASSSFLRVRANRTIGTAGGRNSWVSSEIARGQRYYILITTAAGLYRYFMNDLVEVTGRYRRHAAHQVRSKGKRRHQPHRRKALRRRRSSRRSRRRHDATALRPRFFFSSPTTNCPRIACSSRATTSAPPSAVGVAADVDHRLGELNVEYHSKRASGRLVPLTVALLRRGAGEAYKAACVRAGQREGQFKPAVLQYRRGFGVVVRAVCHTGGVVIDRFQFTRTPHSRSRWRFATRRPSGRKPRRCGSRRSLPMELSEPESRVPGPYVTGETLATARAFLSRHEAALRRDVTQSGNATRVDGGARGGDRRQSRRVVRAGAGRTGPPRQAASAPQWRRSCRCRRSPANSGYTAVLGDASASAFHAMAERYWRKGFRDFKVKLSGDPERDREKMAVFRKWPEDSVRVRADANNLWHNAQRRDCGLAATRLSVLRHRRADRQEPARRAARHRTAP